MAVQTEAKAFLSTHIVQSVVNDIYIGRVIFSSSGSRTILADNYKPRAIEIYDVSTAPLLNHYRLRVPKYGAILEFLNFAILLVIFVLCITCESCCFPSVYRTRTLNVCQSKIWITSHPGKSCSSSMPPHLLLASIQPPMNMAGIVSTQILLVNITIMTRVILSLHRQCTRLHILLQPTHERPVGI